MQLTARFLSAEAWAYGCCERDVGYFPPARAVRQRQRERGCNRSFGQKPAAKFKPNLLSIDNRSRAASDEAD
ncbi:hypothetical protein NDU88_002686 [Pleurodeles waltl]|uniref:Uncharacterized protein n=1 Tax=Pleurodeles waltl TaxID=8319 RepID=A0AAV7M2Y2_PLEWA|nr:hypothetical protein NDU88_002686 [Pleurodeles waltl]